MICNARSITGNLARNFAPNFAALIGLGLLCCPAVSPSDAAAPEESALAAPAGPAPLVPRDLPWPLDRAILRLTNPTLTDAEFDRKWAASLDSPLLFLRAFPGGFHQDLRGVPAARVPGLEGMCLGDAHPDNFGFQLLGPDTRYVFNDLDDSGPCPIAFDAARYFTALLLAYNDPALTTAVLDQYIDTLRHPAHALALAEAQRPDWERVRRKALHEQVQGDRFVYAHRPSLSPTPPAERAAILAAVQADPALSGPLGGGRLSILDIATETRDAGGSGGLRRYWLLCERGGARTILELKQATAPGVELGRHAATLPFDERLPVLQTVLWGQPSDWLYVTVSGLRYLVRDRLTRRGLSLDELDPAEREEVLRVQASYLAQQHRPSWGDVRPDELRAWLWGTSQTLASRWLAAYQAARPYAARYQ